MCYPVCGVMHIKEPVANVAAVGFLFCYLGVPFPYVLHHITINIMC